MIVAGSLPADQQLLNVAPTEFQIEFLDEFFDESDVEQDIDASGLTVNGLPADEVVPIGPRTLEFRFFSSPVVQPGRQVLDLAEGTVVRDSDQAPVAAFHAEFGYDPLPTQVVSVTPSDSAVSLPLERVSVTFNEPYDPASVDRGDLTLSQGQVVEIAFVDAWTIDYLLQGVEQEEPLQIVLPDGAVTDAFGNLATGFSSSFLTDTERVPLTALEGLMPQGSLVYTQTMEGTIDPGDVDEFSITVDSGQTVAVLLKTDEFLQARVEILSSDRAITNAQATSGGQSLVVQTDPVRGRLVGGRPTQSDFVVRVEGVDNSSGRYSMQLLLNAAFEEEDFAGPTNDGPDSAVDLEAIFAAPLVSNDLDAGVVSLAARSQRAALWGSLTGPVAESESFEQDFPGGSWTVSSSTEYGRVQVTGAHGAATGDHALIMDVSRSLVSNLNEAVWSIDLTGVVRPILAFSHASFGDERHPFAGMFDGQYNADGVAISVDGEHWYPVFDAPDTVPGVWHTFQVDLAQQAAVAGISLEGPVQIKFQQFDNSPVADDGRGWDQIAIHHADDADWLRLDLRSRESVSLLGTVDGTGDLKVDLFDDQGNLLSRGRQPAQPVAKR